MKTDEGKSSMIVMLVLALLLVLSSSLGILSLDQVEEKLPDIKIKLEEGLEIIKTKSYDICSHAKWNEIKAAGVKTTETSLKGFLQICERLVFDIGNLQIYADLEARVMWVYSDSSNGGTDTEVYYVQFT